VLFLPGSSRRLMTVGGKKRERTWMFCCIDPQPSPLPSSLGLMAIIAAGRRHQKFLTVGRESERSQVTYAGESKGPVLEHAATMADVLCS
jgi:hypothetical protein